MGETPTTSLMSTFDTPVMMRTWSGVETFNQTLRAIALEHESNDSGVNRSNAGGWHSRHDLAEWDGEEIDELTTRMRDSVIEITAAKNHVAKTDVVVTKLRAWANVSRRGNFNKTHNHPNYDWSGVYYVTTGEPDPSIPDNGTIEFLDPRGGAVGMLTTLGQEFGQKMRIKPHDGLMILFPSWLLHTVLPYEGPGERISIAFNANVQKMPKNRLTQGTTG